MATDQSKVYVGLADQSVTGAIASAPLGTEVPDEILDELPGSFEDSGYCNNEGLSLSTEYNTSDITEWNGATIRKVLETFTGQLSWTIIQLDYEAWCQALGPDNVTRTPANEEHGELITIRIGAHLPPRRTWVFRMKDGDMRMMIVVPVGQITSLDEITFNATDPIALPLTLDCYDDGHGESIYIYTDDGQKVAA